MFQDFLSYKIIFKKNVTLSEATNKTLIIPLNAPIHHLFYLESNMYGNNYVKF